MAAAGKVVAVDDLSAELKAKSWVIDTVYAYKNSPAILDFWVANSRKIAP